ncbi:MAG TPA: lanthionine synthetase C family protein [Chitinophaga sp.]|uniref:lanthionine synthetase C family protein n=1 Tax=Chitinophaga sp. TaxID=1869181 RepID=UPI002DB63222|nr:lanthionine synthetase C family protein [Chitinophaga sp.]HEU4555007.1 lanthionine synthetase C family protein [Chitinophaga sp.]
MEKHDCDNDTLLNGQLGLIFYYYHLYKVTERPTLKHKMESLLEQVIANIHSKELTLAGPSLSTGAAGLGYVISFLCREGVLDAGIQQEMEALDKYLFNAAAGLIAADNTDYLHGALGVVHYFSGKWHTAPHISRYLDVVVEQLCNRAVQEGACRWFRGNPVKANGKQVINFSLSRGQCGILLVLINAFEASAHRQLIADTLKGVIRFILKHKMDVDFSRNECSFFPFVIRRGAQKISAPNRLAWCYGDLNQVLLFYRAGRLLNDESLLQLADLTGMQSMMRRDEGSTMVTNSSFCHGAAGLSQLCKTLYHESNQAGYKDGYEYWIEKLLLFLPGDLENGMYTGREHDYLEGLTGPAFALLSYVSGIHLNWSKILLL